MEESKIKKHLDKCLNFNIHKQNEKTQKSDFTIVNISSEKLNSIYSKYKEYNSLYKECFAPKKEREPLLDEHKVIAILMIAILEIGMEVESSKGNKFKAEKFTSELAFFTMEYFLQIHYEDLFYEKKQEEYKILSNANLNYPLEITSKDNFSKQFQKSLYFTRKIAKNNLNVLFLSNIIFFIDSYNQEKRKNQIR